MFYKTDYVLFCVEKKIDAMFHNSSFQFFDGKHRQTIVYGHLQNDRIGQRQTFTNAEAT